jgi:hypothetical protein
MKSNDYKKRVLNALDRYRKSQSEKPCDYGAIDPGGPRPKRKKSMTRDDEHTAQADVVRWLESNSVLFCAVPNGSWLAGDKLRRARQMTKLKAEGLRSGVPDLLIFTPPPACPGAVGAALEMKREGGDKPSEKQLWWLDWLGRLGWQCSVQYGAAAAISWLESLGYGSPQKGP